MKAEVSCPWTIISCSFRLEHKTQSRSSGELPVPVWMLQLFSSAWCFSPLLSQVVNLLRGPCVRAARASSRTASCCASTTRPGTRTACNAPRAASRSPPPATFGTRGFTAGATTNSKSTNITWNPRAWTRGAALEKREKEVLKNNTFLKRNQNKRASCLRLIFSGTVLLLFPFFQHRETKTGPFLKR